MDNFVKRLTLELQRRQLKNSEYSMRAFARDLGVDQSLLTKILNGKRKISKNLESQIKAQADFGDTD